MGKYHDLMASEMRTRGLAEYLFPVRALSKRMRGAMRADGPDGQNTAPSPTPAGAALGCLHCGTTEPPCVTARWFRGDPPAWPLKGTDTS